MRKNRTNSSPLLSLRASVRASLQADDFVAARAKRAWPFTAMLGAFARLLGRKEGISAFTAGELELLRKAYNQNASISEADLRAAFELADEPSVTAIVYQLNRIAKRKER